MTFSYVGEYVKVGEQSIVHKSAEVNSLAYIGEHTNLGANSVIEGLVIVLPNSVVLPRSSIGRRSDCVLRPGEPNPV